MLEVQQDLDDIFPNSGDGAELMEHAVDTDGRYGRSPDRGKENPAERITKGSSISTLKGFDMNLREGGSAFLDSDFRPHMFQGFQHLSRHYLA